MSNRKTQRALPPPWEHLSSWVAVVETGSVSAAARRLGISQAGVSQHVRQLEGEFDTSLLDRTTRPSRPTAAGQRLYEQAAEMLSRAGEMAERVRELSRAKRPLVRLGCVDSFAATIGPQLVRGLLGRLHRVRLTSGLSSDLNHQFLNRQLDLLMTNGDPGPDSPVDRTPLFAENYLVALPPGYAVGEAGSLLALSRRLPLMQYSIRSSIGGQIDGYLRRHDPGIERNFEFDATDPLLSLVGEGLGFALTTPLCLWQSHHHAHGLQLLPLSFFISDRRPYPPLSRQFQLVFRAGELGGLPQEVASLVKVTARELQRQVELALGLDSDAVLIAA